MRRSRGVLTGIVLTAGLFVVPAPATAAPDRPYVTKAITIGTSVDGRAIRAYFRGDPGADRVALVLGQMHGDESAGPRTVRHIRTYLKPKPGTGLWLIPTMNPDGRAHGTRTNARGVDLNRNWPTSGWIKGTKGSRTYGGPSKASEPETRAVMRFLKKHRPLFIVSIHQPLNGIGIAEHRVPFQKRLAAELGLKRKSFSVGQGQGQGTSPTLTGWYNRNHTRSGTAITVEYPGNAKAPFVTKRAGKGILRASRVHP